MAVTQHWCDGISGMPEMERPLSERTNEQWITVLSKPGPDRDAALGQLRPLLIAGLGHALKGRAGADRAQIEDYAQESLLKILGGLASFRGESRFTTWAQKIAVNVAFSEMRRRHWKNVSLDQLVEERKLDLDALPHAALGPEKLALQERFLAIMRRFLNEELTTRQRQALVASFELGMPPGEVARRMGISRNALYKLEHDARRKLRAKLLGAGFSAAEVISAFADASEEGR